MAQAVQHTDVIFVVEGTALCGAYLHELRSQYIIPTLEHFSGPIDEKDCGSDSNYCLYGLVVFHAADALPGFLIDTVGPLNTSYKLLCQIDRIKFNGGHGEAMSSVVEGLASAMECLEDLASFRNTVTDSVAKKHIILVCNCKPYGIPVSGSEGLSDDYIGKTVDQLAADMLEKEIHLSIMSPRKIPSLIQLFDHAGGDIVNQKGYSRDVRHLILLNGFNLKVNDERPPSPVRVNPETFPLSTTPQGQLNPNAPPSSIQLSVSAQQVQQPILTNTQTLQHPAVSAVSQQSPMMQLPRSPVSANIQTTSGIHSQQHSPMGAGGMQSPSAAQMQQGNMSQLSQQQAMQMQQQQQQQQMQQQQMFAQQQQQQTFRNPRPMTPPAGGQPPNIRGAMMNPHQQMTQHMQMNQQQAGIAQQQSQLAKLQQQQAFQQQQQQQQQAQMQNIALQQQQQNQTQQGQNQNQMTMQQGQQLQSIHNQQQQQQNMLQQQQAQMQQQGQGQMLQGQTQNQMPILQGGQNPILQQQSQQMNMLQQGQNPGQQQQQGQNTLQGQHTPMQQQQQGQIPLQQQPGQQMSMSPGPRWPNQMNQQLQQMQMAQQQSRIQTPNQIPPHPQPTSSPLQRPPQEILARLNQPPMVGSPTGANPNAAGIGNIQQQLGSPTLQRERRVIWNGYLEWHEKQKERCSSTKVETFELGTPEGLKIPRQVPCQVSSSVVNGEPEVKGDGWPSKLIMQLIPKQIVGNLGGTYFLDVKTVLFILQNNDALVSLTKVMDSGFAGCVHFTGSGMPQNACTIKVLILLYSKERHAYLGFIPNDQAGFVDRIRKVIQQQKTQQAAIRQTGPGIPPSIPQAFTGPGMQGGMVIQGQGSQSQQSSPGLPVTVQQMSSQQQGMMSNPSQLQQQLGAGGQIQPAENIELERQQNVLKIQQLQQALEQAQQQLIYTQQLQNTQGPTPGPGQGQIMNQGQGPMALPNQGMGMGNQGGPMTGQGQMAMQQGQMIQGGQGMRPGMAPQRMQGQGQGPGGQLNTRLKHLLQQPGSNVGQGGGAQFNRMRMPQAQGQQNQMPQQQAQASFHEDLGILDLLK